METNIDWGLDELHNAMISMLDDLHKFCIENDIKYCLAYGSVLGAVRHGGFIPWDDDVDIHMTYEDYIKFENKFEEFSNGKYYLQKMYSVDGNCGVPKIRLNNSYFSEPLFDNLDIHKGIYIDIFILYNAPKSTAKKLDVFLSYNYAVLKTLSLRGYKRGRLINTILSVLRLFPDTFLMRHSFNRVIKLSKIKSDYCYDFGTCPYKVAFWKKDMFFPSKLQNFEGLQLYIPRLYDEYLKIWYGDYLQIPDLNEIKRKQHATEWSTNVESKNANFKDEKLL